jgi:hypothetical protein
MASAGVVDDFTLLAELEASEPPEARGLRRDAVRLLVSHPDNDSVVHTQAMLSGKHAPDLAIRLSAENCGAPARQQSVHLLLSIRQAGEC